MKSMLLLTSLFIVYQCAATVHKVKVSNFQFSPKRVNAVVGDTILWIYKNGFHTTTSTTIPAGAAPWDSPMDVNTTKFSYVVSFAGTYNYFCLPHAAQMQGIIRVFPAASAISITDFDVRPDKKGLATITWKNMDSSINHISILKSLDGIDFIKMKEMSGRTVREAGRVTDNERVTGYAYYLLEAANNQGDSMQTAIIGFAGRKTRTIVTSISPNPLTSPHLMITYNGEKATTMKVLLQDKDGRIIKETFMTVEQGVNQGHLHLEAARLPAGTYYLICIIGSKKETHKLTKL